MRDGGGREGEREGRREGGKEGGREGGRGVHVCMNNQVYRALFRKEGEGKERERKKITTTLNGLEKYSLYSLYGLGK